MIRIRSLPIVLLGAAALAAPAAQAQQPQPPVARVVAKVDTTHGDVRVDNYFWLRDDQRKNPDVISYLEAENRYTEQMMAHTQALQDRLFEEIKGRTKETDLSVPDRIGPYYYYTRTEAGKQYPIFARKRGNLQAAEEVLLDLNQLAEGKRYFSLGAAEVSPDHRLAAFAVDTTGAERYELMVKDLSTGQILPDRIPNVNGALEWAADNRTLFYGTSNAANRPYRVSRHVLGTPTSQDVVVGEEPNELFRIGVSRTKDRKYLLLSSGSFSSSETRFLDASNPTGEWRLIQPRQDDVQYGVEHHNGRFLIRTNDGAVNFRLVEAPVANPGKANWKDVVPASETTLLDGFDVFRDHLALFLRENAQRKIRIVKLSTGERHDIAFTEEVYNASGGSNPEFDTNVLRFGYNSMVTPFSVYDYDMDRRTRELKKQNEVVGGYDASQYGTERTWARAPDGTMVPVSLVYRKPFVKDGSRPLLLYAYGSYGISTDPNFSVANLSLLDRGVVYAIAHIRGGQEMGRRWYDEGKLMNKKNTFTDFIASAEHLIAQGYTSRERLAIRGGSAGGLLMGAVVNMRPDLFKAVVADVPFVDVINTMLDASIPLTAGEWLQWGDPRQPGPYAYMKSYSPYDNVERKAYPAMLVTTGLNDPRVAYWEPAKWVAKLRTMKTDRNPLLLRTNMGAGHGGASGRYEAMRETAIRYAFILDQLGIKN